jgi:hypothetical protein
MTTCQPPEHATTPFFRHPHQLRHGSADRSDGHSIRSRTDAAVHLQVALDPSAPACCGAPFVRRTGLLASRAGARRVRQRAGPPTPEHRARVAPASSRRRSVRPQDREEGRQGRVKDAAVRTAPAPLSAKPLAVRGALAMEASMPSAPADLAGRRPEGASLARSQPARCRNTRRTRRDAGAAAPGLPRSSACTRSRSRSDPE